MTNPHKPRLHPPLWRAALAVLAGLTACAAAAPAAQASFTPDLGSPFGVGTNPYGVVVSDFDSDTRPDVVTINGTSNDASVLLRRPAGGFAQEAGSPVAVGTGPNFGAAGDFSGDGRPDVAVSSFAADSVTVLVRQAGSGFAQALGSPVATGDGPAAVAAADFNGDTLLDLAVPNYLTNSVTILLRQGAGFAAETGSPSTGANPRNIAAADFNGDGRPDLAVTNLNANSVTILLRNAGPGFTQEGSPIAVDAGPAGIAADDLDADGRPDLVVASSTAGTLTVLLRTGSGFTPQGAPIAVGATPLDIATGDFNGDRARDLAVTSSGADSVSVLLRAGAGYVPDAGSPIAIAGGAYGVRSADFNADGRPDLAISNDESGRLTVLLNTTPPRSGAPPATGPPPPRGGLTPIKVRFSARWAVSRRYTRVRRLVVQRVPAGARVVVRCKGRGCPFKRPKTFKRTRSSVSLTKAFKNKRVRVGAVIEIAVSAPNRVGVVRRYKVRSRPRAPKASTLCLPIGSRQPRRTC